MNIKQYFINNFNPLDYNIKCTIFDKSTNFNNVTFEIKEEYFSIWFKIISEYNKNNELIKRHIRVSEISTFKGEEIEYLFDLRLDDKKFISSLNKAIANEKARIHNIYIQTIQQKELILK